MAGRESSNRAARQQVRLSETTNTPSAAQRSGRQHHRCQRGLIVGEFDLAHVCWCGVCVCVREHVVCKGSVSQHACVSQPSVLGDPSPSPICMCVQAAGTTQGQTDGSAAGSSSATAAAQGWRQAAKPQGVGQAEQECKEKVRETHTSCRPGCCEPHLQNASSSLVAV